MALTFAHPLLLLLLIPLAYLGLRLGRKLRGHSRHWRLACWGLPWLAVLLLAVSWAEPRIRWQSRADRFVVLLDLSPSTRTSPWRSPTWVRTAAAARLPANARVTVVGFATHPQVLLAEVSPQNPAAWPLEWPPVPGEDSRVDDALAFNPVPEARMWPRWLITDGANSTSPLISPEVPLAVSVLPASRADFGIAALQWTESVPHESRDLLVRLAATGAGRVSVRVQRDGEPLAEQPATFSAAGQLALRFPVPAAAGDRPARFDVRLLTGDPWPEDDTATLWSPRAAENELLVVTQSGSRPAWLKGMPHARVLAGSQMPADLRTLWSTGAVILDDVPRAALPPGSEAMLSRFVRDTGGGLLLRGAKHAFGPGDYFQGLSASEPAATLEGLSPLASASPDRPPLHLLFLLDASGSMAEPAVRGGTERKFNLAAQGVEQAVRLLRPDDRVTVLTFAGNAQVLADTTAAACRETLGAALRAVQPTGPTSPDQALPLLEKSLTPQAHLLLLTDGEIPRMAVTSWARVLTEKKTTLTVVAPPEARGELAVLEQRTQAKRLATEAAIRWPDLLQNAVAERLIGQVQTQALQWQTVAAPTRQGIAHAWTRVWLKPESTLRVRSAVSAIPLAAVARRGLGTVAAAAFEDNTDEAHRVLQGLLRDVVAPPGDRRFSVQSERTASRWDLAVEAVDEARFLNSERLSLRVLNATSDRAPLEIFLPQQSPGRYAASVVLRPGDFAGSLIRETAQGREVLARLQPPVLPTNEWPAVAPAFRLPKHATAMDLRENATPQVWQPRQHGPELDARIPLWLAAIGLLLAALLLRRLRPL